ncbi:MAG: hypothetical protein DWH79_04025 [Planctomycetota bacterium]|nr:MAG: hypothetical protein DWH79_04025 [Planctomycetota bacterium]
MVDGVAGGTGGDGGRKKVSSGGRKGLSDGVHHGLEGDGEKSAAAEVRTGRSAGSVGVRLSTILPVTRFIACDDIVARGCHDDPDLCKPGDVFVARLAAGSDGHEAAARAIARGVSGIIAERIIPTFGTPLCIVPDTAWAQARLEQALVGDPAHRLKVIAVTGTSGKTTTAWLVAAVLSEAGHVVGVLSDIGCLDANATEPVAADLGQPGVLAKWLARLEAGGCSHAVVEVSSAMLSQRMLAGVPCDTVVVTNLARAHLDDHGSVEAYHEIKGRIVEGLTSDGCLVANVDDPRVRRLVARWSADGPGRGQAGAVIGVGLCRPAELSATAVERSLGGQTFLIRHGGHSVAVGVSTPVASFVRDALLAAAVGLRHGVPLELVARGLEATGSVTGRLDRLRRGQEAHVFVDHPTSGHALATTLASLRRLTPGKLVVIAEEEWAEDFGGGHRFACRAARWCNESLVVPSDILHPSAGRRQISAYARIDRLLSRLGRHDCVLLLGTRLPSGGGPSDPGESVPLAALVDAWLAAAHPAVWGSGRRAA